MGSSGGNRGLLIVFEGIDGSGKSTQWRLLGERLVADGTRVVMTREPTDGPHGRRIRESATSARLPAEEELALFLEDRREHVATLIGPSLAAGKVVVVDRYYFSTMAYQGARGIDPACIRERNEAFAPAPDLLFLVELPVEAALARIAARDGAPNLFERGDELRRCAEIFAGLEDEFLVRLDGTLPVERLQRAIHERVVGDPRWAAVNAAHRPRA